MDTTTNRTASNFSNNQFDQPEGSNVTDTLPTVLCVEDDADQRMLLRAVLEHFGFYVMVAKSGLDALAIAQWSSFEAALLDYELPDMTGAQLAHELRAVEPNSAIILLSGYAHLSAGELIYVDAHLVKGSPISELLDTIHSLTGSPQWAQSLQYGASVSQAPPGEASVVKRDVPLPEEINHTNSSVSN
jgi:CheY-like chemotaxis protein